MFRPVNAVLVLALLIGSAGASPADAPEAGPAGKRRIQNTKASLKPAPSGTAKTLAVLNRGDEVEVVASAANGYVQVRAADGKTGYVMASALTTPEKYKGIGKSSAGDSKKAGEEIAVHGAAKGWDQATEKKYAQGMKLDREFAVVDQIVKGPYPSKSIEEIEALILKFAAEGNLGEGVSQ